MTASVAHVADSSDTAFASNANHKEISTMETIHNLINNALLPRQSKLIFATLMALPVLIAFLGATGCSPPHH